MKIVFTKWSFDVRNMVPILEVLGEADSISHQRHLLNGALMFITRANKFKGRLAECGCKSKNKSPISISFNLMFPSNLELGRYMDYINKTTKMR